MRIRKNRKAIVWIACALVPIVLISLLVRAQIAASDHVHKQFSILGVGKTAIAYWLDKGCAPTSVEQLICEGYIRRYYDDGSKTDRVWFRGFPTNSGLWEDAKSVVLTFPPEPERCELKGDVLVDKLTGRKYPFVRIPGWEPSSGYIKYLAAKLAKAVQEKNTPFESRVVRIGAKPLHPQNKSMPGLTIFPSTEAAEEWTRRYSKPAIVVPIKSFQSLATTLRNLDREQCGEGIEVTTGTYGIVVYFEGGVWAAHCTTSPIQTRQLLGELPKQLDAFPESREAITSLLRMIPPSGTETQPAFTGTEPQKQNGEAQ